MFVLCKNGQFADKLTLTQVVEDLIDSLPEVVVKPTEQKEMLIK